MGFMEVLNQQNCGQASPHTDHLYKVGSETLHCLGVEEDDE